MNENTQVPHSPEAEIAIIGSIFNECGEEDIIHNLVSAGVTKDYFFEPRNLNLFTYALDKYKANEKVDMVELATYAYHHQEKFGTPDHIANLYSKGTSFTALKYSIKLLNDMRTRRILLSHSQRTLQRSCDLNSDLCKLVEQQESIVETIRDNVSPKSEGVSLGVAMGELQKSWKEGIGEDGERGVSLGVLRVDVEIGRAMPGDLVVFGGKPSTGKSVSLIQMSEAALSSGKRILVFSLEMESPQVGARLLSCASSVDYGSILRGNGITIGCKKKMTKASEGFSGSIKIYDKGDQTMDYIESIAKVENDRDPVDLIVIDYWQIIESHDHKEEIRRLEYTSRRLKQLAKITKSVVATGSQLNEQDQPYGSKAILKDANVLLRIVADENNSGYVVEKSRNSARGQFIPLTLNGQFQRFE